MGANATSTWQEFPTGFAATDATWKAMRDSNWSNGDYIHGATFGGGAKSGAWRAAALTGDDRALSTLEVPEPYDRPLTPAKITQPFGSEPLRERRLPVVVRPGTPQVIQFEWKEHVDRYRNSRVRYCYKIILKEA